MGGNGANGTWDPIVRVAAGIAAGVGVLGFVTLAGGVVLFERFEAAGLPTEHALAVIPKQDLLVIGAEVLVPLAISIAGFLFLFWIIGRVAEKHGIDNKCLMHLKEALPLSGFGVFAVLAYFWYFSRSSGAVEWAVVLGAATAGAAVICAVASYGLHRDQAGWFAVITAAAVTLVALAVSWAQVQGSPLVRPTAIVFNGSHRGLAGIFIAETSDDIYVAEVAPDGRNRNRGDGGSGRMIEIPRAQVGGFVVGSDMTLQKALRRARQLERELVRVMPQRSRA